MYPIPFKRSNSSSSCYYFKYYDPTKNKRQLKSTGCLKKMDAVSYIKKFIDDLDGNFSSSQITLKDYLEPWLDPNTNPRFKRYRIEGKQYGLRHANDLAKLLTKHVLSHTISKMVIAKISRGNALDFRSYLFEVSLKNHPRVANKVLAAIKSVFSEGIYRGELKYNPFTGIGDIKYREREKEILTIKEVNELLKQDNFSTNLAFQVFLFAAYTGMRLSEVLAVHWEQLNKNVLTIDRAWIAPYELGPPKWGKERTIPLPKSVMLNLPEENPKRPDLIFQQDNARLGNTWWTKNFKAAVKKSGIKKDITAHCLRHSLNSHLLVSGVSPFLIQQYLGWSNSNSLSKTQIGYTHVMPEHLILVSDAIENIYSGKNKVLSFDKDRQVI